MRFLALVHRYSSCVGATATGSVVVHRLLSFVQAAAEVVGQQSLRQAVMVGSKSVVASLAEGRHVEEPRVGESHGEARHRWEQDRRVRAQRCIIEGTRSSRWYPIDPCRAHGTALR